MNYEDIIDKFQSVKYGVGKHSKKTIREANYIGNHKCMNSIDTHFDDPELSYDMSWPPIAYFKYMDYNVRVKCKYRGVPTVNISSNGDTHIFKYYGQPKHLHAVIKGMIHTNNFIDGRNIKVIL